MASQTEIIATLATLFSFFIVARILVYFDDEAKKKEAIQQSIRRNKIREQEKEIERLIQIEKDALREWMEENDDDNNDVNKVSDTVTFTFEEQTTFVDVATKYPKLFDEYSGGYLNSTELDSSDAFYLGNGLMIYILIRTRIIVTLCSLNYSDNYLIQNHYTDDLEVFTVTISTKEEKKPKKRSRKITQKVKNDVWNRDGGRCVECDSNENLEFDHIIPHSKGGANTYRNIQLLCQDCNRTKSAKIG